MMGLFVLSSFSIAFIPSLVLGLAGGVIFTVLSCRSMKKNGIGHSLFLGIVGGVIGLFTAMALITGEAGAYTSPPDEDVFNTTFMVGIYSGLLPGIVLAGGSFTRLLAILKHKVESTEKA
ncbi:MAG: hypothetical protein PQJ50_11915 [Spirochaetales bacterium]|nr:hypothetical protein [Spirochaetales bacterium]